MSTWYSVTWVAIRWLSFESRVEAFRLQLRKGRIALDNRMPATRTTLAVSGLTTNAAIKRANTDKEPELLLKCLKLPSLYFRS